MTMMRSRLPPAAMLTMAGRVRRLSELMLTEPGEKTMPPTRTCKAQRGEQRLLLGVIPAPSPSLLAPDALQMPREEAQHLLGQHSAGHHQKQRVQLL